MQSRLPRGLRGSLRSSTHPARLFARAFTRPSRTGLFGKKQSQAEQQDLPPPDQGSEDFELICHDEASVQPGESLTDHRGALPDANCSQEDCPPLSHSAPPAPAVSCTKSSLFRSKNYSKASIHLSVATDRASSCPTGTTTEESDLYLAFPQPPTHIPVASVYVAAPLTTSAHSDSPSRDLTSSCSPPESNPLSTDSGCNRDSFAASIGPEPIPGCPSPAHPPVAPAQFAANSVKPRHRFVESFRRFKTFSQILRESFISHSTEALPSIATAKEEDAHNSDHNSEPFPTESTVCAASYRRHTSFGIPSSVSISPVVVDTINNISVAATPVQGSSPPAAPPTPVSPVLRRTLSAPVGRTQHANYEFVCPSQLAASPSPLVESLLIHSARSSFILPSPSWLGRNVRHLDPSETESQLACPPSGISALSEPEHLRVPGSVKFFPSALFAPDSPRALPIPPPLVPVPPPHSRRFHASPYRPSLQRLVTDIRPASPETDTDSFVTSPTPAESTLYSSHSSTTPTTVFATAFPSPSQAPHRRLTSFDRINIERHRSSIARAKKARLATPRIRRRSFTENRPSLNPVFKDICSRRSPCGGAKVHLVKAPPSPLTGDNSSDDRTIFLPSRQVRDSPTVKPSPLPKDLASLLEGYFVQSGIIDSFSRPVMDYTAKNFDAVDFGGEVDYSSYQWFQERPPRPEPQPVAPPFVPTEDVIRQNEAFDFALKAAPNVLYGRFKQYGQLGVLAWCSEFGEMIDSLKELGFSGNMFVATRVQALKTCEDILKLKLDIKMQIILMYLSSQVARLRRFLDGGERQWNDYPVPEFPLDYRAYAS